MTSPQHDVLTPIVKTVDDNCPAVMTASLDLGLLFIAFVWHLQRENLDLESDSEHFLFSSLSVKWKK